MNDNYPDAVEASDGIYTVLIENDKVRVSEMRMPVGGEMEMHSHPTTVVYALDDSIGRWTMPDGSTKDMEIKAGQALYHEPFAHAVENIGETEIHLIVVEMMDLT